MPFRSNMFGDKIAQPGTERGEIDEAMMDRHMPDRVDIHAADVFAEGDEKFGFGGTLYLALETEDEESGEASTEDVTMEFDGFASPDEAKAFAVSLGIPERSVTRN